MLWGRYRRPRGQNMGVNWNRTGPQAAVAWRSARQAASPQRTHAETQSTSVKSFFYLPSSGTLRDPPGPLPTLSGGQWAANATVGTIFKLGSTVSGSAHCLRWQMGRWPPPMGPPSRAHRLLG